jgi:hypothetical protein
VNFSISPPANAEYDHALPKSALSRRFFIAECISDEELDTATLEQTNIYEKDRL